MRGKTGSHDRGDEEGDCGREGENETSKPVKNDYAINKERPSAIEANADGRINYVVSNKCILFEDVLNSVQ